MKNASNQRKCFFTKFFPRIKPVQANMDKTRTNKRYWIDWIVLYGLGTIRTITVHGHRIKLPQQKTQVFFGFLQ